MPVVDSSLRHLSCLTNLQQLVLPGGQLCSLQPSALAAALQHTNLTQLTSVQISGRVQVKLDPRSLPAGLCPPQLQVLQLDISGSFEPAVLAHDTVTQLQPLLLPRHLLSTMMDRCVAGKLQAVLAQLAGMTQPPALKALTLGFVFSASDTPNTSNHLQHLALGSTLGAVDRFGRFEYSSSVPIQDVMQSAFPAGVGRSASTSDAAGRVSWEHHLLPRLVSCCPGLRSLDASGCECVDLAPLLQLKHLTALAAHIISDSDAAVLAQLPSLRRLEVGCDFGGLQKMPAGGITAAGLMQLSALQLTCLWLCGDEHYEDDDDIWDEEKAIAIKAYAPYRVLDSTLAVVAQLTSLWELRLRGHMNVSDRSLLQLTVLTQLTQLEVMGPWGLFGFGVAGSWVNLPTKAWCRGFTLGAPVWPELLERVLRSHCSEARQLAQQAVLANRAALCAVMGPELAAALPHMRLRRSYEEMEDEVDAADGDGPVLSWTDPEDDDQPDGDASEAADEAESAGYGAVAGAPPAALLLRPLHQHAAVQSHSVAATTLAAPRQQQEEVRTAATAMRERLALVVRLLATSI